MEDNKERKIVSIAAGMTMSQPHYYGHVLYGLDNNGVLYFKEKEKWKRIEMVFSDEAK